MRNINNIGFFEENGDESAIPLVPRKKSKYTLKRKINYTKHMLALEHGESIYFPVPEGVTPIVAARNITSCIMHWCRKNGSQRKFTVSYTKKRGYIFVMRNTPIEKKYDKYNYIQ